MARRFYGFYLLTCEDIGMKPQFLAGRAGRSGGRLPRGVRNGWSISTPIPTWPATRGFRCRSRSIQSTTRFWATVGVRLAHLNAAYARPPRVRPKDKKGEWQEVESYQIGPSDYVIPVVEFAEFETSGSNALSREEFRAVCDRCSTKEEIVRALQK